MDACTDAYVSIYLKPTYKILKHFYSYPTDLVMLAENILHIVFSCFQVALTLTT